MTESPLRDWAKAVPFTPFAVTMSSGRVVNVLGPEMMILGRRWDTVAFVDEDGYDRTVLIHHRHINSIDAYDRVQSSTPPEQYWIAVVPDRWDRRPAGQSCQQDRRDAGPTITDQHDLV